MPGLLARSRSLRMLRGGHKETSQREEGGRTPPRANEEFDMERLKAATPVTRADGRVETPDMLQRPKTSGGQGDRGKLFHKKVAPVTLESENRTLNFPFPSPSKSTVLYAAEVHEEREGIIGIALGSPTMASHWNTTPRSTDFVTSNHGTITEITSQNNLSSIESKQEASKPKLSRWKSIFGKRPQPPQEKPGFYQLAQTVTAARADSPHDDESVISAPISKEESRAASPPTYKPDIRESRKTLKEMPQAPNRPRAKTLADNASGRPKTIIRTVSSPKTPPKDAASTSSRVPQVVVNGSEASSSSTSGKGLLDVDIPSIHMERYSVMFGSLLQPNNRSSSLLVRRQGAERLKPLNDLSLKKEDDARNSSLKPQRRATSPSYPKSPSVLLSLFPQPTTRESKVPSPSRASVHRPRPLQRSKTAPSVSPSRPEFAISKSANAKDAIQTPKSASNSDVGMKTQLLTPTPSSRDSFDEGSEEITIAVGQAAPWNPRYENEPQWEIVSKPTNPPSNLLKNPASQDRSPLPNPLASHKPSTPSSAPLEPTSRVDNKSQTQIEPAPRSADAVARGIATVGVARSVSVSRANRPEFLKPTLVRAATDSSERLVDTRALTPTLVELKNRKSQRVQLVEA